MLYLLGLSGPEALASLEEQIVTDSEFYDELQIAEDELIDQYLSGELSETERERFEHHFMRQPERQKKVRFGQALTQYVQLKASLPAAEATGAEAVQQRREVPKPPPKPWYSIFLPSQNPLLSYSLAAVLLLVVAGVAWLVMRNLKDNRSEPGAVYAVVLSAGTIRSGDPDQRRSIKVPPGTGTVSLKLSLPRKEHQTYRATLLSDAGEVAAADNLQPQSEAETYFIVLNVRARLLPRGAYLVRVNGHLADGSVEPMPSYQFLVLP